MEKNWSRGEAKDKGGGGRSGEVGDKRDYSGAGEGVTNRVPSLPFSMICHSEVINHAGRTNHGGRT